MSEIILYDLYGTQEGAKAWSPNVWSIRLALNYKGLKYKTHWVEFPDVESTCKKVGATPTTVLRDGSPKYTLPVIYDPSTKSTVTDSVVIADYLEKTYPGTPPLFPPGTRALHAAFHHALRGLTEMPLYSLIVYDGIHNVDERAKDVYRASKEEFFGKKLEDIAKEGEVQDKLWKDVEEGMKVIGGWIDRGGKPFIGGDRPIYSDLFIASRLFAARNIWGEDSKAWAKLSGFGDGRWGKYLKQFEKYASVD